MEEVMSSKPDNLLPHAKDFMKRIAISEAEEAEKAARQNDKAEAEKRKLLEQLERPSGVSDAERIKRAVVIIERAVRNGKTEVQLIRFPSDLCSDHGRAINQGERGWESTLQGLPKELYEAWAKYFQPRGYKLRAEIVDFTGDRPGDVGMTLSWN
jgi:hypothetical protein